MQKIINDSKNIQIRHDNKYVRLKYKNQDRFQKIMDYLKCNSQLTQLELHRERFFCRLYFHTLLIIFSLF